ncbi:MAG: hypothetical protein J6333_08520 [Planctomycetes bacterium]|nr:hypothetical protein [Planctomycetota bacterium]
MLVAAPRRKGFAPREGDHQFFCYQTASGKTTSARTKVSHGTGSRTLQGPLLGQMARQCRLSAADFLRPVDCPLSREDYEAGLVARKEIAPD